MRQIDRSLALLDEAQEMIAAGWCQGALVVRCENSGPDLYCAIGAARFASARAQALDAGDAYEHHGVYSNMRRALDEAAAAFGYGRIEDFNDAKSTSQIDVLVAYDIAKDWLRTQRARFA